MRPVVPGAVRLSAAVWDGKGRRLWWKMIFLWCVRDGVNLQVKHRKWASESVSLLAGLRLGAGGLGRALPAEAAGERRERRRQQSFCSVTFSLFVFIIRRGGPGKRGNPGGAASGCPSPPLPFPPGRRVGTAGPGTGREGPGEAEGPPTPPAGCRPCQPRGGGRALPAPPARRAWPRHSPLRRCRPRDPAASPRPGTEPAEGRTMWSAACRVGAAGGVCPPAERRGAVRSVRPGWALPAGAAAEGLASGEVAGPVGRGGGSAADRGCRSRRLRPQRACGRPRVRVLGGARWSWHLASMPAELKQVSAELASVPSARGVPQRGGPGGVGRRKLSGSALLVFSFLSWELRAKAEMLFLTEPAREILLLSLLC